MTTTVTRLALQLIALLFCGSLLAEKGNELMEFFRVLNSCYQRSDVPCLVRLAASTKGKDLWNMARGAGPHDEVWFRIRALTAADALLFDEDGRLRAEIASALGDELSPAETELLNHLRVDPADTTQMLQLLSNADPSVRWIAIYKTRFVARPAASFVQALRGVAAKDDYVFLADIRGGGPPSTHPGVHTEGRREFIAPLRVLANEQLAKWNEQVPEDPHDIARAGLKRLLGDFAVSSERQRDVLDAVSRFHPEFTPVAKAALDRLTPETPDQQRAIEAFRNAAETHRHGP